MCSVDNLRLIAIKKNRSLSLKATIPPSARGTLSLSLSGERSTIGTDSPSSLLKSRFVQLDPRARSVKRVERPRVASAATRSRFPAFAFIVTSSRTDVTIIHFSRSILLLFSFPSFSLFFFFLPSSSEKLDDEREEETRAAIAAKCRANLSGSPLWG